MTFDNASGTPVTGDRAIAVIVNDGAIDSPVATASVSVALPQVPGTTTAVEARVAASTDDAEENANTNSVNLSSTDLELAIDGTRSQIIGLRFSGLDIPPGVVITNAYIQFTVDEVSTGAVALEIRGEDTDNAQTFSKTNANISSRADTFRMSTTRSRSSMDGPPGPWGCTRTWPLSPIEK